MAVAECGEPVGRSMLLIAVGKQQQQQQQEEPRLREEQAFTSAKCSVFTGHWRTACQAPWIKLLCY